MAKRKFVKPEENMSEADQKVADQKGVKRGGAVRSVKENRNAMYGGKE